MSKLATQKNQSLVSFEEDDFEDTKSAAQGLSSPLAFIRIEGKTYVLSESNDRTSIGSSFNGVIVGVGPLSKRYFSGEKYEEGKAPDCVSANGEVPDASVPEPQCDTCMKCAQNVWGSKISDFSGKQMKKCQDYRRVVVAILGSQFEGGYKLYRLDLPTMSLNPFKIYAQYLREHNGCPLFAVATHFAFNSAAKSYPMIEFTVHRVFSEAQVAKIRQLKELPLIQEMLSIQMNVSVNAQEAEKKEVTAKPAQKAPTKKAGEKKASVPPKQAKSKANTALIDLENDSEAEAEATAEADEDNESLDGFDDFTVDLPGIAQTMKDKLGD